MIEHTFCHLPGIGESRERRLWQAGIVSWDAFLAGQPNVLPHGVYGVASQHLKRCRRHPDDAGSLSAGLPPRESWRLLPAFRHSAAYLDIETTGLDPQLNHITTIAVYDGHDVYTFVHGRNLEDFARCIAQYQLIVTFSGKCFDIPFIEQTLDVRMRQPHIDLRYVLRSLGFTGGLKAIERQFGINREELEGVDGAFAIVLWDDFVRNGNEGALETLLAYNVEDVVNLELLAVQAYNRRIASLPIPDLEPLPLPTARPFVPYRPHMPTIDRLRGVSVPWR
jgi:hypothetical protein